MVSCGERPAGSNAIFVLRLVGVRVDNKWFAVLQQQCPAAVAASNGRQDSIRATRRNYDVGGYRPRPVFEVRSRTLRDADHSRKVNELIAASGETRPDGRIGA